MCAQRETVGHARDVVRSLRDAVGIVGDQPLSPISQVQDSGAATGLQLMEIVEDCWGGHGREKSTLTWPLPVHLIEKGREIERNLLTQAQISLFLPPTKFLDLWQEYAASADPKFVLDVKSTVPVWPRKRAASVVTSRRRLSVKFRRIFILSVFGFLNSISLSG